MKPFYISNKSRYSLSALLALFLTFTGLSSHGQCWEDYYVYQVSPSGQLCSPQYVTLRAEYNNYSGNPVAGEFRWYTSDTDPNPVHSQYISNWSLYSDYSVYATNGATMWVSFFNYDTQCESYRYPYTFYISQAPSLWQDYATQCRSDAAKVQVSSNTSGVTFQLFKLVEYYDYNYGWVQDYQLQQSNSTGYFEIYDFYPPNDEYSYYVRVYQPYGCGSSYYYPLWFDITEASPPSISGNLTVNAGSSTTLYANGRAYDFKWYDAAGNFLQQGYSYTTPANLSPNTYTYKVQGVSADGTCTSDMASATVTVNFPAVTYGSLYNSSNFTKSIDLSKPVGTINGSAGTTASGGITYSIPIYTPPGTTGLNPSVSIHYSSQGGNGNLGQGWSIAGLSAISRAGKNMYHNGIVTPTSFTNQDAFVLDGMRLNPISGTNGANGTIYAGEVETFTKIISHTASSANNPDWFQATAKDGTVMEFGHTADSRVMSDDGQNVILWRLNKITDISGNYIEFKYDNGFRDTRIDEINYTGNQIADIAPYNKIKFNYAARTDVSTSYDAGASFTSKALLSNITVTSESQTVKTYQFTYGFDNITSFLKEITETGSDGTSLNSTIFLYGDQPQNTLVQTTYGLTGSYDFFSGDFDADGKTDLLAAQSYYDQTMGTRLHSQYSLFKDVQEPWSTTVLYTKGLSQNTGSVIEDKKIFNFLSGDYNGDGRDDVLEINSSPEELPCIGYRRKLSNVVVNYTKSHNGSTGYTDYVPNTYGIPTDWVSNQYQYISQKGHFFIPGDFDGDGNRDYILVLAKKRQYTTCRPSIFQPSRPVYTFDFKAFLTSPSTYETNQEVVGFGFGPNPSPDFYAGTVADADMINTIDFDGDGKMEILVVKDGQSYILSIQRLPPSTGQSFASSVIYTSGEITKDSKIYPGDFNGDRKTDILARNSNGTWKVLYSTGKAFVASSFTFVQTPNVSGSGADKISVADFNGDGKSDVLHGFAVWVNGMSSSSKFSLYYSRGGVGASSFYHEQYLYNKILAAGELTPGDFNGDGRGDLLNRFNVNSPADFISFKPFGKERLLVKVTDGHNTTYEFQYKLLTDKTTYPYFYERTMSLDDPSNMNPYNYVELPMHAVSAIISPNGIGGTNTTTFNYENAVVHRAAKGFLGFRKIISRNAATGIKIVTDNNINTQFGIAYNVKKASYKNATGELLNESQTTTVFDNLSTGYFDKRSFQKVTKMLNINYVDDAATEIANTYDNYGNITTAVSKVGTISGTTVNAVETTTTTSTFSIHNTPVPSKPDNVTVTRSRNSSSSSATTQYSYNSTGLVSTKIEFAGLPKAVTTTYSYNGVGGVTTSTTSATGLANRTSNFTFDSKGRFVTSKKIAAGTSIEQTENITFDGKWGKPLSVTSTDCQTTTFEYDGFGRLKKTISPVFTISTSYVWDVQGQNIFYTYTDYLAGRADVKTWSDRMGRETKQQKMGYNSQWLTKTTTYDALGNVATQTNPYYLNETPITTTNTYDGYNRLQTVSNGLNTVTYSYTKLAGGNVKLTISDAAGQNLSRTSDPAGRIVTSSDKGGDLHFTYNSQGLQTEVKHGGMTIISSAYDPYGRQTSLTDKNAGTITYEYDAFGQLVKQTDSKGTIYQMTYDQLGRITGRQGSVGSENTTYEYYNVQGCGNNNLAKITGWNNVQKQFTYDALKRLQSEAVTVDGVTYTTQYAYDAYSNINKITYPSGVEINKNYSNEGILTIVWGGTPGDAQPTLFYALQMNSYGKYTSYGLANGKTSQVTYQNGFPTRYYAPGVQDLNLSFDYAKGNLTSRQDAIRGITESFQYDGLNRLTQASVNGQVQLSMNYDGNSSFSMGNITSKTDAGNYVYKSDKIHAVAYIQNPAGPQAPPVTTSTTEQTITYTPFSKPATITENPYTLAYTYGPDYQRIKSELKVNNVLTETKYYFGSYEKQIGSGFNRDIHYVHGGDGLCAIIVRENGANNFYTVYKDHLGSILTLTHSNGAVAAEQNFDAWGRNRNPLNWGYASVPAVPAWLYRGYTGHEHLAQFALINMNGRMYDPAQGRMLGPDNYVPTPFGTQGYNRFAYAMNNPLIYTDPDGNFPWLFIAVAAAVFATGNTVAHAINGDIHSFWDGLKYFAQGAVAGAAIGTGVAFGLGVPILGPILKGAAIVYAGTTALSVVSGLGQGIFSGDWSALANAGRIFVGNFYLDENKSFFGGVFEGISRFSWQLPQSAIGYGSAAMVNTFGGVRSVTFYGGATAVETFAADWGGITQGSFIIGNRGLQADPNNPLFQHEYGHYLQSQTFGLLYYGKAGIPSLFSRGNHNLHPVEQDANGRAFAYFNRHVPGYSGWNFIENPILDVNFRLGFHWYDPIDFLGVINTIVLNRNQ